VVRGSTERLSRGGVEPVGSMLFHLKSFFDQFVVLGSFSLRILSSLQPSWSSRSHRCSEFLRHAFHLSYGVSITA